MIHPRCNSIWAFTHLDPIENHVKKLINEVGFGRVITVGQIDINQHLITTLVKR